MTRVVVVNVGASRANPGRRGPIFHDGKFIFIPISSDEDGKTYGQLELGEYLPKTYLNKHVHNDPEFDTFTYGHAIRGFGDCEALCWLEPGDYLFFLATLSYYKRGKPKAKWINPDWGAYFVAYFRIQVVLTAAQFKHANPHVQCLFRKNAHTTEGEFDVDWAIKGDARSAKLNIAVPLSKPTRSDAPNAFAKSVLLAKWLKRNPGREPNGWYRWTHTCSEESKVAGLWEEIDRFNPNQSRFAKFETGVE